MDKWYLGIDIGTGSCKAVVIDARANVIGFGVGQYPSDSADTKWQEQDPRSILKGVITSVRSALVDSGQRGGDCGGLSLGGALHSLMALDQHGQPLTGVITWADRRAAAQAQRLKDQPQTTDLYQRTGCPIHGMYPLYKILWLKEERPDIFTRAANFVSAKEYIFAQLTGQYWVDYSLAAGSGLLNTHNLDWDDHALALAGIPAEQLSELHPPTAIHPGLEADMAQDMGLPMHTPVILGSSDAANSNLGAGAVKPWQATLMVGTSGAYRFIAEKPILDKKARSWCYAIDKNHWLVGGAINNGGLALSWWRDALNQAFTNKETTQLSFDDIISLATQVEAGAGGVLCLPFFAGERSPGWNLNARGAFFGLSLEHDTRHMARALLEGISFRFRSLADVLEEIGAELKEVRASGGFTKSSLWLKIMASILNRDVQIPTWGETSSLGAAFWVLLSLGIIQGLDEVSDLVKIEDHCQPSPEIIAVYEQLYPIFKDLYQATRSANDDLTKVSQEISQP
jgi:gluconokinase